MSEAGMWFYIPAINYHIYAEAYLPCERTCVYTNAYLAFSYNKPSLTLQVVNPVSAVTSGCRFSCSCVGDSGCNISFYYGKDIAEVQELRVCETIVY